MTSPTRLRLYVGLLLLTLLAMAMLYSHHQASQSKERETSTARDLPEIQAEGTLRLLTSYQGAEQGYKLAQKLGQKLFLKVDVHLEDNTAKALELLNQKDVDLVLLSLVRTTAIDSLRYRWVQERVSGPVYLAQRQDSLRLKRQLDIAGKTITIPRQSPLALFAQHLAEELGDSIHIAQDPLYNTEQLLMLVSTGRIDYTLCTQEETELYAPLFPQLDLSLPISYALRRGWLVRAESQVLADSLSKLLLQ